MNNARTETQFPLTLPGLLARNAQDLGERIGLREKDLGLWQEVSWREYQERVMHFCLGLENLGLMRGDHLAIIGDNCREWIYADLAAQALGAVGVGVYATNPAKQVAYVMGHSDSVIAVAKDQEQTDKILEVREALPRLKKIVVIDMKGLRNYADPMILSYRAVEKRGAQLSRENPLRYEELVMATRPEDVALMVYTSGTTGPPKGAMLTHRNLISICHKFEQIIPMAVDDQIVSYLPLCHIAERLMTLVQGLNFGYTANFTESVATVGESLYEISPTIFVGVPRIWEKMHAGILIDIQDASALKRHMFRLWMAVGEKVLKREIKGAPGALDPLLRFLGWWLLYRTILDKLGLVRVRLALSGAAPISPEVLKFFRVLGLNIAQVYGQTEITGVSHYQPGEDIHMGSVGMPLPGIECKLADDGEILLKGETLFAGYYRDESATRRAVVDGWLHTGDVGEFDGDGRLTITDRKKDILITSGGKNIAPSEIENRLKVSPYINEAIVIGDARPYLTALIQVEMDTVAKWATDRGIPFTTFKSLSQRREVRELVEKEVAQCNRDFAQVETVKKFTLLDKELDHDDDELTATMKVRRSAVEERFKDLIDRMYLR